MSALEKVVISWDGRDFTVEPDKVLKLIAIIEEEITFDELANAKNVKRAKLAMAYAAAIRFAGGVCADAAVYDSLFSDATRERLIAVIESLIMLMVPPARLRKFLEANKDAKKKLKAG